MINVDQFIMVLQTILIYFMKLCYIGIFNGLENINPEIESISKSYNILINVESLPLPWIFLISYLM